MIVAASRMLTYLQSLQWHPVQNREIKFYKGFFRKKEISNILSIKKENIIEMIFLNNTLMLTYFSSHSKFTCIYNT